MSFIQANLIHLLAAIWFIICWAGYTRYASWKARDTACLASVMHLYREDWMRRMLLRDNRIADASVIGNLERNASFFASSTLIILAGILTVLGASDRAVSLLADLPLVQQASQGMAELKLLCLALVFVYAFFTFSWCMRQYNFAAVLVGSAPMIGERHVSEQERKAFASRAARVISMAANQFNFGLRSYYFGMTMLAWFVSPWLFMLMSAARGLRVVSARVSFGCTGCDGLYAYRSASARGGQGSGLTAQQLSWMPDTRKPAPGGFSFAAKTVSVGFRRGGRCLFLLGGAVRFRLSFGSFGVFFRRVVHFILCFVHVLLSLFSVLVGILSFVLGFFIAGGETEGGGQHQGNSKSLTHGVFLLMDITTGRLSRAPGVKFLLIP